MRTEELSGEHARSWMEKLNYIRAAGTREEKKAAEQIAETAGQAADAVLLEPFSWTEETEEDGKRIPKSTQSQNVLALLRGTGHEEGGLILTAHYDSVPQGPGAYDNLSSCAVMMELLFYFSRHRPSRTLRFVFFGAEERGLVGSQAYVMRHRKELDSCIFNFNSDLAGQDGGEDVIGVTADEDVCAALASILAASHLPTAIKHQVWASDSNSFAAAGIPAVTYDRDGYGMHTPEDTLDRITPGALRDAMLRIGAVTEWIAGAKELPFARRMSEDFQEQLAAYFSKKNQHILSIDSCFSRNND